MNGDGETPNVNNRFEFSAQNDIFERQTLAYVMIHE
jgi:hypothetical protein